MQPLNHSAGTWALDWQQAAGRPVRARRDAGQPPSPLPPEFLPLGAEITAVADASLTPSAATRRGMPAPLEFSVSLAPDESAVLAVRHAGSGALTFHAPQRLERRGSSGEGGAGTVRFRVRVSGGGTVRRGIITQALKLVVVKIKDAVLDKLEAAAIGVAGEVAESLWWRHRGLHEGLFQVRPEAGRLALTPVKAGQVKGGPALLLLHGTFSNANAAFNALTTVPGDFFQSVQSKYGDRLYAFNHFTVSRTPEENARSILDALPDGPTTFDVLTHSRGGLVLRSLVERAGTFGTLGRRFALGQAVLVASPNVGTPLATAARWEQTVGLVANLLEMLPDNPWTTGADFVANGLLWLAKDVVGSLPGLASMDADGPTIADLQEAGGRWEGNYWALAANYHPAGQFWQRLVDAGADAFFAGANDLVVPAEGGWLVDAPGAVIPAERIACFGPGGNLGGGKPGLVHHLNFFSQPETVQLLLRAFGIGGTPLPPLDPRVILPTRGRLRAASAVGAAAPVTVVAPHSPPALPPPSQESGKEDYASDTLQLMILDEVNGNGEGRVGGDASSPKARPVILAMYGSARVVEAFPIRNEPGIQDDAGSRFRQIIALHEQIRMCLDGRVDSKGMVPPLPNADTLREFGELLFEALFIGSVRRLYDVARSEQRDRPLNIVFTCTVPWIAALPWEFAFDPSRRKFLATEEVHFVRNVLTAVPAQRIARRAAPLRILIVAAQPKSSDPLALEDEEARLKHSFDTLVRAKLAEVDVLVDATPTTLHDWIQARDVEGHRYDIVHFIGHGQFDAQAQEGRLLMMGADGGAHFVDVRTLREIFCGRGIHLVFLNACDTAHDSRERNHRNRGVAQALVEGGLPAVVANQYKVLDSAAIAFSERFYWSLALGASLGEAAREARIAVNYSLDGEVIDWAVPVLHARDSTMRLCARLQGTVPVAKRTAAGRADRSPASRARGEPRPASGPAPLRVGIADIARHFSDLPQIVDRINQAQSRILVEIVPLVVPLGVWEIRPGETFGSARRYLVAERFAEKLKDRPRALGVDYLACVTDHPMRDESTYNLYGWWSAKADQPILIFSTWNLALPSRGIQAGRAIANQLVESLAAQLMEADGAPGCVHERGARDCPFHYNAEREVSHIVGPLQFDSECRRKLLQHLPKKVEPSSLLTAFDAILRAFDGTGDGNSASGSPEAGGVAKGMVPTKRKSRPLARRFKK